MIRNVEGDILLTKASAIANGMAPNDPMTHGLARTLHERYPAMHKDFHHWCHQRHGKLGDAWMWGGAGGVRIVNLLTQEAARHHPGRAKLSDVNHALRSLRKVVERERFSSLALPKLATGTGGLDWADVLPLIERHLGDIDIPVFVYTTYHPGMAAKESGL